MVGVLDVPGGFRRACLQQRLHLVEQGGFHNRLVRAGMQRAFVADHTCVVGVREQLVERVLPQRFRRALRCRNRQQPPCCQLTQQTGDGRLTGRVVLERPSDEWGAFGIDLNGSDFAPVVIRLADVEVSDGCAHRGAALRDFLREPFGDLGGKVRL